ncbi:hypothetical protein FHY13_000398 [Xanthomonas arboricola]|nr:hypothetical protein [Xanthomonas euroxanthea]
MHTDHLDWPLPARRRGTLSGMDAAPEPTRTYLRRVLRWWAGKDPAANSQRRGRGALTACRTRSESVPGGSVAASMPPHGPAIGEDTAPDGVLIVLLKTMHTEHLDGSLPAHRRGTLSGMDAAPEPTRTYLRRVLRWWAGKGPAVNLQRRGRGALTAPDSCVVENHAHRPSRRVLATHRRGTFVSPDQQICTCRRPRRVRSDNACGRSRCVLACVGLHRKDHP